MTHEIFKKVYARLEEDWDIDQTTGEPEFDSDYAVDQETIREEWHCTCGMRFRKANIAVKHVELKNS